MSRKKEIKTTSDIIKYVESLIKCGHNSDMIKAIARSMVDSSFICDDVLYDLVDDTVNNYPSYELMQTIMNNKLVIDKNSKGDTVYVVNPRGGIITSMFRSRLTEMFTKVDFSSSTYMAEFTYNPYEFNVLYKDGILWYFNQYNPAKWFSEYFYSSGKKSIPVISTMPQIYDDFLDHLVDYDEASKNYILNWLANAIRDRNYTILTTIGNQGIGKGVLGDIMMKLVGADNFTLTDNKLISKDFNAQMKNKRIIYLDEILAKTSGEMNKFKSLINDTVEVEGKGVDAITTKNYASIYTSSNDLDAINLSADDRRFSVVNLTNKKLKDHFEHNIGDLLTDENIAQFGYYLWNREYDKRKMLDVFISPRTSEIRAATLTSWQDYMLTEYCVKYAGRQIELTNVAKDIREALDDYSFKIGRIAFQKLQAKYPKKFEVIRPSAKPGKARKYFIKINDNQNDNGEFL